MNLPTRCLLALPLAAAAGLSAAADTRLEQM